MQPTQLPVSQWGCAGQWAPGRPGEPLGLVKRPESSSEEASAAAAGAGSLHLSRQGSSRPPARLPPWGTEGLSGDSEVTESAPGGRVLLFSPVCSHCTEENTEAQSCGLQVYAAALHA